MLESLPDHMEYVNRIRKYGNISEWDVTVERKDFKWKAETVRVIPNESIGWTMGTGPSIRAAALSRRWVRTPWMS